MTLTSSPQDNKLRVRQGAKPDFQSHTPWQADRPNTLVVACSDGRLQECTDEFLKRTLNVRDYDRLYIPGGAGAMADGGSEFIRAEAFRRSFLFLLEAHGTEQVVLLTHAATDDGPPESVCAHYRRIYSRASVAQIRDQMARDVADIARDLHTHLARVRLLAFRADVAAGGSVQFTDITPW